jgi:hypothetical protein
MHYQYAVHIVHADNVLAWVVRPRGRCGGRFFLGWDAFILLPWATAFFTRAMGRKRLRISSRGARATACRLRVLSFLRRVGAPCVLVCFLC